VEPGKYSFMAEATARLRAAHQVLDDDPKILDDPLVLALLGDDTRAQVLHEIERHSSWYMKRARTLTIVRSRFTEDQLRIAIDRGVSQYVILGAGLDTSPYRAGHPGEPLATWEIDHPDSQRWKLDRLRAAGIEWRENLHHVAIDFESRSLLDGLLANGFDPGAPTFFSWLGVLYYLQPDSVTETFRQMASCSTGSGLVFDFVVSDDHLTGEERAAVEKVAAFAESRGEPWLTRYAPEDLQAVLQELGFGRVEYFSRDRATAAYLAGRSDGLALDPAIEMMSAVVTVPQ